jgi:hypothetical protein
MTALEKIPDTRPRYDWKAVELKWRIGNISDAALAKQFNMSTQMLLKRAKSENWQRDLKDRFKIALQSRLAEEHKPDDDGKGRNLAPSNTKFLEDEERMVQAMAQSAVLVVLEHRKDLRRLRGITSKLTERLDAYMDGKPIKIFVDGSEIEAPFMNNKESVSDIIEKLSRIHTRVQGLERVAFSIDEKVNQDPITLNFGEEDKGL